MCVYTHSQMARLPPTFFASFSLSALLEKNKGKTKKNKSTTAPQNVVLMWLRSETQMAQLVANLRHYSQSP